MGLMRPGIRFRTRSAPEGGAPAVAPPIAAVLLELGFVVWLFVFVLFAALSGVGLSALAWMSPSRIAFLALAGGVLPLMAAWSLATQQRIARWLVVLSVIGICLFLAAILELEERSAGPRLAWSLLSIASLGVVSWSLFLSRPARAWSLALSGRPIPRELLPSGGSGQHSGPSRRIRDWSGPLELLLVALGLLIVISYLVMLVRGS